MKNHKWVWNISPILNVVLECWQRPKMHCVATGEDLAGKISQDILYYFCIIII